jgi:hypothetical protein
VVSESWDALCNGRRKAEGERRKELRLSEAVSAQKPPAGCEFDLQEEDCPFILTLLSMR